MDHWFFLLYTISALSGMGAIVYFVSAFLFDRKGLYKEYLYFLLSYSLIMVSATISIYLQVNTGQNVTAQYISNIGILAGFHLLAYTLSRFVSVSVNKTISVLWKRFFLTALFIIPAVLIFYILMPHLFLYICLFGLCLFGVSFIYSIVIVSKVIKKKNSLRFRIVLYIAVFISPLLAVFEELFFPQISSIHGFSLNLPINYLLLNTVSIIFSITAGRNLRAKSNNRFFEKYQLTKQEIIILEHIINGKSNKEIAELLFISPHTVKNHIYSIYQKTRVNGRFELISRFKK